MNSRTLTVADNESVGRDSYRDAMPATRLGRVAPRHASQIAASPLGVGFECLDRQMFDPERVYDRVGSSG